MDNTLDNIDNNIDNLINSLNNRSERFPNLTKIWIIYLKKRLEKIKFDISNCEYVIQQMDQETTIDLTIEQICLLLTFPTNNIINT